MFWSERAGAISEFGREVGCGDFDAVGLGVWTRGGFWAWRVVGVGKTGGLGHGEVKERRGGIHVSDRWEDTGPGKGRT
jgi:hypothetical protein